MLPNYVKKEDMDKDNLHERLQDASPTEMWPDTIIYIIVGAIIGFVLIFTSVCCWLY